MRRGPRGDTIGGVRHTATVWVLGSAVLLASAAAAPAASWKTGVRSTPSAFGSAPPACDVKGVASFPSVAVDPTDSSRLTALWLTDGVLGVTAAVSEDGGRTWLRSSVPAATACDGGPAGREVQLNPRMAVGPTGRVWFGSSWGGADGSGTGVHVTGPDGAFGPAVALAPGETGQSVAVVPHASRADEAVALWARIDAPGGVPLGGDVVLQRTADGGQTWSAPAVALRREGYIATEAFAVRTPDGTLVALTSSVALTDLPGALIDPRRVPVQVDVAWSSDDGRTWSAPHRVGAFAIISLPDPEGKEPPGASRDAGIAAIIKPDLAVGPDGEITAAWAGLEPDGTGTVQAVRSRDAGRTWSLPEPLVRRPAPVFSPHVAYDEAGRLGVMFYDWADDRPGDEPLTTTARVAVPDDGALVDLPAAFDLRRAYHASLPYDGGQALGVTQDIQGMPRGFAAVHTVAPPLSRAATEVRLTTVVERKVPRRKAKKKRAARRPAQGRTLRRHAGAA